VIFDPTYASSEDIPIYTPPPSGIADPAMTGAPSTIVDSFMSQITSVPSESLGLPTDDEDTTVDVTSTLTLTFFQCVSITLQADHG
jgi:hypothetical protein